MMRQFGGPGPAPGGMSARNQEEMMQQAAQMQEMLDQVGVINKMYGRYDIINMPLHISPVSECNAS